MNFFWYIGIICFAAISVRAQDGYGDNYRSPFGGYAKSPNVDTSTTVATTPAVVEATTTAAVETTTKKIGGGFTIVLVKGRRYRICGAALDNTLYAMCLGQFNGWDNKDKRDTSRVGLFYDGIPNHPRYRRGILDDCCWSELGCTRAQIKSYCPE